MMKMARLFKDKRDPVCISCFFLILFFLYGCHSNTGVRRGLLPQGSGPISRLAVIPFQVIAPADHDARMLSCPLCNAVFQTDRDTQPAAGQIVQDIVLENLRGQKQLSIITPDAAAAAYRHATGADHQANLTDVLQKTAKELGVEAILIGYVFRYRDLKGRSYSAEKPASVAFELHLVRAGDGVAIWSSAFDKTQESLMENLFQMSFFFKLGIKWVTAKELSEAGVDEIMRNFPGRQ